MRGWSGEQANSRAAVIENNADTNVARAVWAQRNVQWVVADEPFTVDTKKYSVGTIVSASAKPTFKSHDLHLPRVAILHTWLRTQDEGRSEKRRVGKEGRT